jgi:radical SAM superfamily enzyme YgiQ (UPF0313 family)
MRVLLIYPDLNIHVNYPLGLGIISATLKDYGHQTRILHFNEEIESPLDLSFIEKNIIDFQPQLIAFSSVSNQFQYVKKVADYIKHHWKLPTLVGGIHATIAPQKVLQNDSIDFICRGEGEFAMLDLITRLAKGEDYTEVANIGFKKDGKIQINPVRKLIDVEEFDEIEGVRFRKNCEKEKRLGQRNGQPRMPQSMLLLCKSLFSQAVFLRQ